MNEIVPTDARYVPLTQQKWCCVPTCIQMVMLRHNIPLIPAELIGYHMGLVVPEDESKYFWNVRTGKRPDAGWGTQISKPEFEPNSVFEYLGIPLKLELKYISYFSSLEKFEDYIDAVINDDIDVLACFNHGMLFDSDYNGGHVCLIDRADIKGKTIRLIDPDENSPKWREVDQKRLYESMMQHGDEKLGGFWEIYKI